MLVSRDQSSFAFLAGKQQGITTCEDELEASLRKWRVIRLSRGSKLLLVTTITWIYYQLSSWQSLNRTPELAIPCLEVRLGGIQA